MEEKMVKALQEILDLINEGMGDWMDEQNRATFRTNKEFVEYVTGKKVVIVDGIVAFKEAEA